MPLKIIILNTLLLITLHVPGSALAWDPVPKPPAIAPLAWVTTNPNSPRELWAASTHQLFWMNPPDSNLSGWHDAGFIENSDVIKRLDVHPRDGVFILTNDSVYQLTPNSKKFARIFSRSSETQSPRLSFASAPWKEPAWFVGTSEGLYVSKDFGQTWSPHLLLSHGKPVFFLASSEKALFVGTEKRLYRADSLDTAEPVFRFESLEANDLVDTEPTEERLLDTPPFEPVLLSNAASRQLWLTSPQGVAHSSDDGQSWALLSSAGLTQAPPRALAYSEESKILFAAAQTSVYAYHPEKQHWFALEQNFTSPLHSLGIRTGSPDTLIAASENGIFSFSVVHENIFPRSQQISSGPTEQLFKQIIAREPTTRDVQKAVVRYSNLTNTKIRRWHRESRLRAVLPTFSFGRDFSRANTFDLDRGGTADPDHYIAGPDDVDEGWSADLRWDLGDLIWSPSQTSIDIREKLMVDQRRDFLAEAMRIYFERRRVQAQLYFAMSSESRASYEQQLRYEELTALLDSLTGGWFSEQLESNKA